jgi:hypothetical protein
MSALETAGSADGASAFEVRPAGEGDREPVLAVMRTVAAGADLDARWEWMYRRNPHGRALTWLARERATGRPVGCTSLFPRRVWVDGRQRLGAIGGDCFVDPAFRRRGIATALHRASLSALNEGGVEFMYGPPRPNNLEALVKAGSRVVAVFRRWVRFLDGRALLRAATGRPLAPLSPLVGAALRALDHAAPGQTLTLEPLSAFGAEFDRLFAEAAPGHAVVCVRDRAYLEWRYLAAPAARQKPFALRRGGALVGFVALEVADGRASLVDLFTAPRPGDVDGALRAVVAQARRLGAASLEARLVEGGPLSTRFRRHGFLARDGLRFQLACPAGDPQHARLCDATAWHFAVGDEDIDREL